jgi:urease accessory protein
LKRLLHGCCMTYSSTISGEEPSRAVEANRASLLELDFKAGPDGRTYIARQYADYPYHICKAQYLDASPAGMATLYLQSCSGGLFEGDHLSFTVRAGARTGVHLTSQASTIVHSARGGGKANLRGTIIAMPGSLVEYLPDPAILFPSSRLEARLDFQLGKGASVIVSDSFLLHDPSCKGGVPGLLDSTLNVTLADGTLIARDRMRIEGRAWHADRPGIFGQWKCYGIILIFTSEVSCSTLCSEIRDAISPMGDVYVGASMLSEARGVCARFLGRDAVPLREAMAAAWKAARKLLCGSQPVPRRK